MKQLLWIGLIVSGMLFIRDLQIIEFSAARFDIKDIKSNIVWYNSTDKDDWYPLSESRSKLCYEDGLVGLFPDYKRKFNEYIQERSSYTYQISFPNGEVLGNHKGDPDICIYLSDFKSSISNKSPIKKVLQADLKGAIDLSSNYKSKRDSEFYQGVLFNTEMEITGLISAAYADYKLREIWINHLNEVLNFHLDTYKQKGRHGKRRKTNVADITRKPD